MIMAEAHLTYDSFVDTITKRNWATLGIGVVLLVLGGVVWSENTWAGVLYLIIALAQIFISLGLLVRLRRHAELTTAGHVTVQHSWGICSIGIAAAAIIPSNFFAVADLWMAIAVIIGLAWAALGAFNLYWTVQSTDARLTI